MLFIVYHYHVSIKWIFLRFNLWCLNLFLALRAFSLALSNVSNVKYLAHLIHQTQKWTSIRCAKCLKILKHATVSNMKAYRHKCHFGLIFFYSLFSLFSHHFILFSSLSITLYLFPLSPPYSRSLTASPRHQPPQPLPPTFRSLYRVVGVIFGMGFDVWVLGHWLIGWVGILGWWWWLVEFWASDVCGYSGRRCLWL